MSNNVYNLTVEKVDFSEIPVGKKFIRVSQDWAQGENPICRVPDEVGRFYHYYQEYRKVSEYEVEIVVDEMGRMDGEKSTIRGVTFGLYDEGNEKITLHRVDCWCKKDVAPDNVLTDCVDE